MITIEQDLGTVENFFDFKELRKFWRKNPTSKATFICYKFVRKSDSKSYYGFNRRLITYTESKIISLGRDKCDASNKACAAGINVATKAWVDNSRNEYTSKFATTKEIAMECVVKDIVAMPLCDGKFRVCRVNVLVTQP